MRYTICLLLLAGCATAEQRAERAIAAYGPYCERLGFAAGTPDWGACIQRERGDQAQRAGVAAQNAANVREAMRLP